MTATNYAVAPVEYLDEWIEDRSSTQQQAANLLSCRRQLPTDIIRGRVSISNATAIRLKQGVWIPATTWINYETLYRADLTRIADEENRFREAGQAFNSSRHGNAGS